MPSVFCLKNTEDEVYLQVMRTHWGVLSNVIQLIRLSLMKYVFWNDHFSSSGGDGKISPSLEVRQKSEQVVYYG